MMKLLSAVLASSVATGVMAQDVRGSETLQTKLDELLANIDQDMLSDELKAIVLAVRNDPSAVTAEQMKEILSQLLSDEGRRELLAAHAAEVFTTEAQPGYNAESAAVYLDAFMKTMTDEMAGQLVADVKAQAVALAPDNNPYDVATPAPMDIVIGLSTGVDGGVNVNNYGKITITQETGPAYRQGRDQ